MTLQYSLTGAKNHFCTRLCTIALATLMASTVAHAGGASNVVSGVASELTQWLNNAELVASVKKQADMVKQQVDSNINLVQQTEAAKKNLRRLSPGDIASALSPYSEQLAGLVRLGGSINELRNAAKGFSDQYQSRKAEASRLNMGFREYYAKEMALARTRGGIYKRRLDADIKSIDLLQNKAQALRQAAGATAELQGGLEGLQNLAKLSTVTAGELMEMKEVLIAQSADRNQDKSDSEGSRLAAAEIFEASRAAAEARNARNAAITLSMPSVWDRKPK